MLKSIQRGKTTKELWKNAQRTSVSVTFYQHFKNYQKD